MSTGLLFSIHDFEGIKELAINRSVNSAAFECALSEGLLTGKIHLQGEFYVNNEEIIFVGNVNGHWCFECTKCLTPVELPWSEKIEITHLKSDGDLDLTEEVRQTIALAQPMKVLCQPECLGLCNVCRKNLNTTKCDHQELISKRNNAVRLTPRHNKG